MKWTRKKAFEFMRLKNEIDTKADEVESLRNAFRRKFKFDRTTDETNCVIEAAAIVQAMEEEK